MKATSTSLAKYPQPHIRSEPANYEYHPMMLTQEDMYNLAAKASFRDDMRTMLTNRTLMNTAFLARRKAFLEQIAPGASEEYKLILQAYVLKSIDELYGGEL